MLQINEMKALNKGGLYLFNLELSRGNRSQKMRSSTFAAFDSQNYPLLVESGIDTSYNEAGLETPHGLVSLSLHKDFDNNVTVLKIFPDINNEVVARFLPIKNLKGLILETFGSGNISSESWIIECLKKAVEK